MGVGMEIAKKRNVALSDGLMILLRRGSTSTVTLRFLALPTAMGTATCPPWGLREDAVGEALGLAGRGKETSLLSMLGSPPMGD